VAIATINRFISLFDEAFKALACSISMPETERLAILVHQSMSSKTRAYHTPGHVFYMCDGMNPIQVLAALFHDVVYYQLDAGLPTPAMPWLHDVARAQDGVMVLRAIAPNDHALRLCAAVFNFSPGQTLALYGGMNEFLSAVLATRLLQPYLRPAELLAVVACIEATVPFRAPGVDGKTAPDALAERVRAQYLLQSSSVEPEAVAVFVNQTIADAVVLGNRDVGGFAHADPGLFLSSTWLLIDESNAPLSSPGVYSLGEYRGALVRMAGFLSTLDPSTIFLHHNATPPPDEVARLCATAQHNIGFACDFLDAKITSMAIIEALALCTGGDCPVSMFLGDIRNLYGKPERVEDFLPEIASTQMVNDELLQVFEKGRTLESNNDLTASPLTAFIYRTMGHVRTQTAFQQARLMFAGEITPLQFLQSLEPGMVRAILRGCARLAISRTAALHTLDASL
jgi:hypothetical protein